MGRTFPFGLLFLVACSAPQHGAVTADSASPRAAAEPRETPSRAIDEPVAQPSTDKAGEAAMRALYEARLRAGVSDCEQAYESSLGLSDLRSGPGEPPAPVPDHAKYVAACEKLPKSVQRCSAMFYFAAHSTECMRVLGKAGERGALEPLRRVPDAPP